MTPNRPLNPSKPVRAERRATEFAQLVGRIQTLTLELQRARRRVGLDAPAVHAMERRLDQLRWQLAAVARRTATAELGSAA
jgi:hypothetical protein